MKKAIYLLFQGILFGCVFVSCSPEAKVPLQTPIPLKMQGPFSNWLTPDDTADIKIALQKMLVNTPAPMDSLFDARWAQSTFETAEFYRLRNYKSLWSVSVLTPQIWDELKIISAQALNPKDFEFEQLQKEFNAFVEKEGKPKKLAEWEVSLTQQLMWLGNQMYYGKLNPKEFHWSWNLEQPNRIANNILALKTAVEKDSLPLFFNAAIPQNAFYKSLLDGYISYQNLPSKLWVDLQFIDSEQTKLEPNSEDKLITDLRKRMFAEGYLKAGDLLDTTLQYTGSLVLAVKKYQRLHGLNDDGVIGKRTLASMNVSLENRIQEIEINLERLKWFVGNLEGNYLMVNVPYYRLFVSLYGQDIWETKVIVGKRGTKTPMFTAKMKTVVVNPTWTLPHSIAGGETLPKLKKDSMYLKKNNMVLLDKNRNRVDPNGIDWSNYTARTFPYVVCQQPGDDNSLGRIKFLFPNEHYIYLHDTPSRNLFKTDGRAYSHGCIRVEGPKELAVKILNDSTHWNKDTLQVQLDSYKTKVVRVKDEFPMYIIYATAMGNQAGEVLFFEDIYGYDEAVFKALKEPLKSE